MTAKPDATLAAVVPSAPSHGHEHGHAHHHDHHIHAPAAQAFRPPFSLVRLSLGGRLAIALGLSAVMWAAVRWALLPVVG